MSDESNTIFYISTILQGCGLGLDRAGRLGELVAVAPLVYAAAVRCGDGNISSLLGMEGNEMKTWTEQILEDIQVTKLTQPAVAEVLALVILSGAMDTVDWKAVNAAIRGRWSAGARNRVMTMAWKIVEEKARAAVLAVTAEPSK